MAGGTEGASLSRRGRRNAVISRPCDAISVHRTIASAPRPSTGGTPPWNAGRGTNRESLCQGALDRRYTLELVGTVVAVPLLSCARAQIPLRGCGRILEGGKGSPWTALTPTGALPVRQLATLLPAALRQFEDVFPRPSSSCGCWRNRRDSSQLSRSTVHESRVTRCVTARDRTDG